MPQNIQYDIVAQPRGVATGGTRGAMTPTSISEPKKVQQFQFQVQGRLFFMGAQKLY